MVSRSHAEEPWDLGKQTKVHRPPVCRANSVYSKPRRRLSKIQLLDDGQIFTINENVSTMMKPNTEQSQENAPEKPKSGNVKRRGSKLSSKVPDITNFPLLVTTSDELVAATRRKYNRAKSAPLLKTNQQKSESNLDDKNKELPKTDDENIRNKGNKLKKTSPAATVADSPSTKMFSRTTTRRSHHVADSANFREQRQLERQLKGIQSMQKMNISSINKEKFFILQKSKALSSMLYPDVFTGKTPKCTRKGKCFGTGNAEPEQGDSIESGTYLCDPSDGTSPYAEPTKKIRKRETSTAWDNAVHMVLKNKSGINSKPSSSTFRKR